MSNGKVETVLSNDGKTRLKGNVGSQSTLVTQAKAPTTNISQVDIKSPSKKPVMEVTISRDVAEDYLWEESIDDYKGNILDPWLKSNRWNNDTMIRIDVKNATWRGVSGYAEAPAKDILKTMYFDNKSDSFIFKLDGKTLTATRYSHDEPTGATFTFSKSKKRKKSEDSDEY